MAVSFREGGLPGGWEEFESMYGVNAELFDTADEMCGPQRFDRRTKMVADGLGLKQHVAAGGVYMYVYM